MNIISLEDITSQRFPMKLDSYNAYIVISNPPERRDFGYGIMDIFVDGYPNIYGVPMVPNYDLLSEHIESGCLPIDIGTFMIIQSDERLHNISEIANGYAVLMYFSGPESVAIGMFA